MSYKSREAKRRKRAALNTAQQGQARDRKARRPASTPGKWWLTITSRVTCCARCAGILREGREMVFRKVPQEALCVACADRAGIHYRPSARWEQSRRVKVRKGPAWMHESEAA